MKPSIDLDELQIVLTTCNLDTGFFHLVSSRLIVPRRTHLILISRQLEKLLDTIIFLCSSEHKFVIKTKDIVTNDDVGVLSLNQFLPCQQYLALSPVMLQNATFYWRGFIQSDAVIHIRIRISVVHKCRSNEGHLVSFQLWEVGIQSEVHFCQLLFALHIRIKDNVDNRRLLVGLLCRILDEMFGVFIFPLLFLAHFLEERLQSSSLVELTTLAQITHLRGEPLFTHLIHIVLLSLFRIHLVNVWNIVLSKGGFDNSFQHINALLVSVLYLQVLNVFHNVGAQLLVCLYGHREVAVTTAGLNIKTHNLVFDASLLVVQCNNILVTYHIL